MRKIIYSRSYFVQLVIVAILTMVISCKQDEVSPPVINEIRNYAAAPNDTILQTVSAGQWVVLLGNNLGGVTNAYFNGTPASINTALNTDQSIVIQIPSIDFPSVQKDKANIITLVGSGGTSSYEVTITGAPLISRVRNYTPDDMVISSVSLDQQINLIGYNLKNATKISFQGVDADLTKVIYTDSSAIVTVPGDFSGADETLINTISYTTAFGTGSFSIIIIGGPPLVTGVSYEIPNEGDEVIVYGSNLFELQNFTFAHDTISVFETAEDGTWVKFNAPKLSKSGPVKVTNVLGTFTTAYNVNDINTGVISNFQWPDDGGIFRWDWWGGASLTDGHADFPGSSGQFLILKGNALDANAGDEWGYAIRISNAPWVPADSLSNSLNSWALKFEINIPAKWEGGTINIKTSKGDYVFRYEPWQISPTKTALYSTKGWQTITVPLSFFRKADSTLGTGMGAPVESIKALLGDTGISNLIVYMHNYGASTTKTGFNGAFDNFRVVKIKAK